MLDEDGHSVRLAPDAVDIDETTWLWERLQPDGDRILPAEAATLDEDWLSVFDTGLPSPSGGLCIGLERLLLLLLPEARRIDDVIPFPLGTA